MRTRAGRRACSGRAAGRAAGHHSGPPAPPAAARCRAAGPRARLQQEGQRTQQGPMGQAQARRPDHSLHETTRNCTQRPRPFPHLLLRSTPLPAFAAAPRTAVCHGLDHEEDVGRAAAAQPRHRAQQLLIHPACGGSFAQEGEEAGRRGGRREGGISAGSSTRGAGRMQAGTAAGRPASSRQARQAGRRTGRFCRRCQTAAAPAPRRCRLLCRPGTCGAADEEGEWGSREPREAWPAGPSTPPAAPPATQHQRPAPGQQLTSLPQSRPRGRACWA